MAKRNEHQKDSIDDILGNITGSVDELFGESELNSVADGVDAFGNKVGEAPSAMEYDDDDEDSVYMDSADELSNLLSGGSSIGAAPEKKKKKAGGKGQAYGEMGSVDELFGDTGEKDVDELTIDDSLFDGDDMGDDDVTEDVSAAGSDGDGDDDYGDLDYPEWLQDIKRKNDASVAHAFLLHGNVRDYIVQNYSLEYGLIDIFDHENSRFDIIAKYDQAHGLSFYGMDDEIAEGKTLADIYRARFMKEMEESCTRLSIPTPDDIPNRDTVLLFTILSDMFDHPSHERDAKIMLIIDYSDFLVPDASSAQMKPDERKLAITLADIGRSQVADEAGNIMFFITDDVTQLSGRIKNASSRIEHVKIPIPNQEERAAFIDEVLDDENNTLSDGTQIFAHPDSIDKHTFAINSAGLSRIQIEDIMLRALSADQPLTMQIMKERKQEIIKEDYDDVLEIIDPKFGFERIGGLDNMKQFFKTEIIEPIHSGELEAVPQGVLLQGPPGTSKRCRYGTLIPTPNGFVKIEDLQPGDLIFGLDGSPHKVLGKSEPKYQDIYEVILKDGRSIQCSGDHLWTVYKKSHGKYRPFDMTTEDMLQKGVNETYEREAGTNRNNRKRFRLPVCDAVKYPERKYALEPYVMGVFLGDGCKNSNGDFILSSNDKYIPNEVARLLGVSCENTRDYSWVFKNEDNSRYKVKDVAPEYATLLTDSYCGDKYIPAEYKIGSVEQRWNLLQGLMDTDGCIVSAKGRYNVRFNTTSTQLADDIMEVAFSLGLTCTKKITTRKGKTIKTGEPYSYQSDLIEISFNVPPEQKPNFFRLPRKKEIAKEGSEHTKRRRYDLIEISDIVKTGEKDYCVCLLVETDDHLFLAGNYVPTHNTFFSKAVAFEANMNFVALNLNRILDKWVGASERNLDRALDCAMAMSPTIIFIDEIDEALPNRADPNQSAVNKRINQRLLTFFSDTSHRGQVMILAATNYPEKIDPAFKRAGRFDMRVPMFAPDEFDRMRIINVIAAGRGFSFSWFKHPDELVPNPFKTAGDWVRDGNVPVNEHNFVGERTIYTYEAANSLGTMEKHQVYLPEKFIEILDKEEITRQQVYENIRILFEDMPERKPDASTGAIASDAEFKQELRNYLAQQTHVLGPMPATQEYVLDFLWDWQTKYGPFSEQTFQMTGAELDVVMNKAITLFRRWKRQKPDKFKMAREQGIITTDTDIPWNFLFDACIANVNATAGIKQMEDMALLNTSDLDFIPDALYAETDDGRKISYRERHEELVARTAKMTLG